MRVLLKVALVVVVQVQLEATWAQMVWEPLVVAEWHHL
jgi:hypothetical protein